MPFLRSACEQQPSDVQAALRASQAAHAGGGGCTPRSALAHSPATLGQPPGCMPTPSPRSCSGVCRSHGTWPASPRSARSPTGAGTTRAATAGLSGAPGCPARTCQAKGKVLCVSVADNCSGLAALTYQRTEARLLSAHLMCLSRADAVRHPCREDWLPPPQLMKPHAQAKLLPAAAQERMSCTQALPLLCLQQPGQRASHVRHAHALPPHLVVLTKQRLPVCTHTCAGGERSLSAVGVLSRPPLSHRQLQLRQRSNASSLQAKAFTSAAQRWRWRSVAQDAAAPAQDSKARGDRPAKITSSASSGTCSIPGYPIGASCGCRESLSVSKVSQHAQHAQKCSCSSQPRRIHRSLKVSGNLALLSPRLLCLVPAF